MHLYSLARPFIFALDAERAHQLTIAGLKLAPRLDPQRFPDSLRSTVAGVDFPSPVGLAAGFDKNAEVPEQMLALGFGFVEVGTITPKAQSGNPRPRMFRLVEDRAVINRLGFNNKGLGRAHERLRRTTHLHGVIGVNVGANKDSVDRITDYAEGIRRMAPVARYLTVNISSPNTPGLRGLQEEGELRELLAAVEEVRTDKPIFLKVAPDLAAGDHDRIVRAALDHHVDALIVANTTVSRPNLKSRQRGEAGGLSGEPLKLLALQSLRTFRSASGGEIPLIGVGGIGNADDAWDRIRAGASLVQLYSAMVYEGPAIARTIAAGLAQRLRREGMTNISELVGTETV